MAYPSVDGPYGLVPVGLVGERAITMGDLPRKVLRLNMVQLYFRVILLKALQVVL
jgi:hypothetical protein